LTVSACGPPLAQQRTTAHPLIAWTNRSSAICAARRLRHGIPEARPQRCRATWTSRAERLEYVIGHPDVTVVRAGTTKATHMLDNLGGGIGWLPNEATRKRMAELVDARPESRFGLSLPRPGGLCSSRHRSLRSQWR
jgi:hypothetical protein